jgi:hypothetical protein
LHNGSVPTLAHLLCPDSRPAKFFRGNVNYDEKLVGFVWDKLPAKRYSPADLLLVKEFDTSLDSHSNQGHTYGSPLCAGGIANIDNSPAGDLLEYLKTR